MVSKRDGAIVLDPHVAGLCVITLDATAATALFDLLGEWLGWSAPGSLAPRGGPVDPEQICPNCVGDTR